MLGSLGSIDLSDFEYLIIYSYPDAPNVTHTWTLPEGSFQMNYKEMVKKGCIIHNVYHRMSEKDLLDAMLRE